MNDECEKFKCGRDWKLYYFVDLFIKIIIYLFIYLFIHFEIKVVIIILREPPLKINSSKTWKPTTLNIAQVSFFWIFWKSGQLLTNTNLKLKKEHGWFSQPFQRTKIGNSHEKMKIAQH